MVQPYGDEIQFFLVDVEETYEDAYAFLGGMGVDATCLLDDDGATYDVYDRDSLGQVFAPFPLEIVIDRQGVISWIGVGYDVEAARAAIDAALAE